MTDDIGMDRNPRATPARAAAQAGTVAGIIMAVVAIMVLVLVLASPEPVVLGKDVLVWPVAVGVAVAGVLLTACSVSLQRRVRQRDTNRLSAQNSAGNAP